MPSSPLHVAVQSLRAAAQHGDAKGLPVEGDADGLLLEALVLLAEGQPLGLIGEAEGTADGDALGLQEGAGAGDAVTAPMTYHQVRESVSAAVG